MKILVSDTSVLLDLERGNLLEACFQLSITLTVPDVLYEDELSNYGGPRMLELGLQRLELDDKGVQLALGYRSKVSAISVSDSFALALAKTSKFILLTGDRALRNLAEQEKVECHGVLWVLDLLEQEQVVPIKELHDGLKQIGEHPRCRLPKHQVTLRLQRFASKLGC